MDLFVFVKVGGVQGKGRLSFYGGIEWSLRAFASMRAVRLFLRAGAVTNFLMRAAST